MLRHLIKVLIFNYVKIMLLYKCFFFKKNRIGNIAKSFVNVKIDYSKTPNIFIYIDIIVGFLMLTAEENL